MEQDKQSMTNPDQGPSFSVITVPDNVREQVLEYLAELTQEDADVSGYMLRAVASPSMRSTLVNNFSGSGCTQWSTGTQMDFNCTDND